MDMLTLQGPLIDSLQLAASMGVKATRANTGEEFHEQFAEAMANKGLHLIDAQIENSAPATIKMIRDNRVP
jgi:acetolactate synthase-1/2/3 large subunit